MSRRARLVFLAVLFGASPVRAASYELGGFYEAGKRSTADDYSEEDDDDLYSYDTSHLKIGYEPFDLHDFGFSSFVTRKNYDLKNELEAGKIDRRSIDFGGKFAGAVRQGAH